MTMHWEGLHNAHRHMTSPSAAVGTPCWQPFVPPANSGCKLPALTPVPMCARNWRVSVGDGGAVQHCLPGSRVDARVGEILTALLREKPQERHLNGSDRLVRHLTDRHKHTVDRQFDDR